MMRLHYLTVPVSVFLGGFVGYLAAHNPAWDWPTFKPMLMGSVISGVVALTHLYMPQPQPAERAAA
jgi:hypothetical protein